MPKDTVQFRGKWHTSIDNDMIRNVKLSFQARFLWILLKSYASPSSPVPFPGFETLAYFMSSFRKDKKSGEIESKKMDEDTLRKYRQELIDRNFLIVERVRNGFAEFENNRYVLLDGSNPHPENPGPEEALAGRSPGRLNTGAKSTHSNKEGTQTPAARQARCEAPKTRSSNTSPSASAAAAAARSLPAATGAGAPDPRQDLKAGEERVVEEEGLDTGSSPESKAERFVKEFKEWAKHAGLSTSITPRDREAVIEYFQDNEEMSVRHLMAIMLCAWQMDPVTAEDEAGRDRYWYSNKKARRVFTFMKHLTEVQDELNWTGTEESIEKSLSAANKRFCVKGRKVVL
jgi:hypothetical protein